MLEFGKENGTTGEFGKFEFGKENGTKEEFGKIEFGTNNNVEDNVNVYNNGNIYENQNSQFQNGNSIFGVQDDNLVGRTVASDIDSTIFQPVKNEALPVKQGTWSKIKAFLFKKIDLTTPIKVELTPYQQKVEDEINAFLSQEISFKKIFKSFKK